MSNHKRALGLISIVLIAVGVLAAGAAVASATIWRPNPVFAPKTTATSLPLVTSPGVLSAGADSVLISATADSADTVVLAIGRIVDVQGWIGSAAHTTVTGLTSRTELTQATQSGDQESLTSPAGNDMWLVQDSGLGTAEVSWTSTDDSVALLAVVVDSSGTVVGSPNVTLTWTVPTSTPLLIPGLVGGTIAVLAGVVLMAWSRRRGESSDEAAATPSDATEQADVAADVTAFAPQSPNGPAAELAPAAEPVLAAEPEPAPAAEPAPELAPAAEPEPEPAPAAEPAPEP
ncbi:hypothetical protein, partial [Rarobacter incanus]|uniref:hypothetical protein n=1 Tax=Rarobacter incanus TaxID=153494 RepID=UPI0031D834EF